MTARTVVSAAAIALSLAFAQGAAAGGKAEAGKAKAAQVCAACHGTDGAKPSAPDQPILAGQYYDYLVKAMSDYKSGKRNNAIMKGFATMLKDQDIVDVAAWYETQPQVVTHRK